MVSYIDLDCEGFRVTLLDVICWYFYTVYFNSSNHNIHVDDTVYEAHVLLVINVQFQFANSGNTKPSLMAFQQKLPQNCMFTCYFCVLLKLIIHVISPFNDF